MSSKLDRYFLGESLPPLLFGLMIYSTLAVISTTLPRLQWIIGTPLLGLGRWLLLMFPTAIVQTLPIAMVLAVLLAFGRLASNNELQAVQAGGISLARSTRVFIMLGLFMATLALYLNQWVLPKTNAQVGNLYWQLTSGGKSSGLWRLMGQDVPVAGYTLHFAKIDRATDEMQDVRIQKWQGRQLTVIFAERAQFTDQGLTLFNYQISTLKLETLNQNHPSAEHMLESLVSTHSTSEASFTLQISETQEDLITNFSRGGFEDTRSIVQAYQDSKDSGLSISDRRKAAILFQRKLAEPFANLSLLLVAVPLSLLYASSRSVAFGLSLLVTLVWYLLFTVGQLFGQAGHIPIWLGAWGSNITLGLLGLYLLMFRQFKG